MTVEITMEREPRPLLQAVGKGLRRRCPRCGQGKLFRAYLKVNDRCPVCGEELHHHRADDLPPYISIVILGHILVGLMLHMEMTMSVQPYVYLLIMVPLAVFLPLIMLPSIKGAVVSLQWANFMHGFDPAHRDPAAPEET
ncbi:MAG: DUF983 domain-containing protein [Devosia sp.]|nr:DUF983 domain-containing protein [Devosia sp.]